MNVTKGHGIMCHLFKEYGPYKGEIEGRNSGVLVSMEPGISTAYALDTIQERGRLFIGPQEEIYEGMIIGENARPDDMPVNPCKAKKLTNMRSQGDGKGIQLEAPLKMSLERALEYIAPTNTSRSRRSRCACARGSSTPTRANAPATPPRPNEKRRTGAALP